MDTKFIINQLNKAPFNKNYTFATFDALQYEELLQVLSDVLSTIHEEEKVEIQLEDPQQTAVRLFNSLRILKYKPPDDVDVIQFKQGLIEGEKSVVRPILKWLLSNLDELTNRAYLAKYLVRINVPNNVLGDSDIATLYRQYESLIEDFTKIHKQNVALKEAAGNKITTSELISDCGAIEREKEIVSARIGQLRRKAEQIPNSENLLRVAGNLRLERERKKENDQQLREELELLERLRQQATRLSQQLQDSRKNSSRISADELLTNLGEEMYVVSYLANQKLPRQLAAERKALKLLQNLTASNYYSSPSNDKLSVELTSLTEQVNRLAEQRTTAGRRQLLSRNNDDDDDDDDENKSGRSSSSLYGQQQAGVVARVKDNLAAKFFELKNLSQRLTNELNEKKTKLERIIAETGTASGEQFKEYVNKLRAQSLIYKRQRGDLAFLKNETNVLSKTLNKLRTRKSELGLSDDENAMQEQATLDDEYDAEGDENFLQRIARLTGDVSSIKSRLLPLISDVRPLKELFRDVQSEHDERKRAYDTTRAAFDTSVTKLRQEVNDLHELWANLLSGTHLFEAKSNISRVNLERANNELQMYTDKNNSTPTLRDRYHRKITESEKFTKLLKEERKTILSDEQSAIKQKELWNNLFTLLQCKKNYLESEQAKTGTLHLERGSEMLVLN